MGGRKCSRYAFLFDSSNVVYGGFGDETFGTTTFQGRYPVFCRERQRPGDRDRVRVL